MREITTKFIEVHRSLCHRFCRSPIRQKARILIEFEVGRLYVVTGDRITAAPRTYLSFRQAQYQSLS
ncbi:hypothetical protein BYT27DRAFT_7201342, partial [Phlegmacium glaucopus]